MLDLQKIGDNIHELRTRDGYSQDKLAELLGVSHQAVSRWECGLAAPSIDNIAELCALFDVSFERLLSLGAPVDIDANDIFAGHSRMYVVKQIADGKVNYDFAEHFDVFMPQERIMLLKAVKDCKVSANMAVLVHKLTPDERKYIGGKR